MSADLLTPENFINRELSWLEFNARVLEEAQDSSQPLMERVKFLGIFSSNLDEFFEIRVAGIKQQIESETSDTGPDAMSPTEVFDGIQKAAHELVRKQYDLWNQEIAPLLAGQNIRIHEPQSLSEEDQIWIRQYFRNEVFPVLTPLAVDASHPFPQVLNKSHNLIVCVRKLSSVDEKLYAIVQVPRVIPRLIRLPRPGSEITLWDYVYLSSLIKLCIGDLFPGLQLEGVHAFRVTRNSDLYIDEEEAENLLRTIEQELSRRNKGNAVRLEVEEGCPRDFEQLLLETFKLEDADLYRVKGPLTMLHLAPLYATDAFARLKDRPYYPVSDPALPPHADHFEVMRRQDVLLHHPYESFDSVVAFVEKAASDPHVLAIKMVLYRTSGDSPIISALSQAAVNGKQVTALVELKARFDEANNIAWAKQLEESGVHVVYGVVGLKTHCKILLVVRRDEDRIRQYVHLGTGNYHPRTARIYTDLSLFTTNPELTGEVAALFNTLTGLMEYPGFKKLLVAPFDLGERFLNLIRRETEHARAGRKGRIIVKINSLVDEDIIQSLYEASSAGVKIDLVVRGICCLRPQIPGVSENIRVISIVGRFLEHSRIFYFENNGVPEVLLGSADWMPRNLYRRVEVVFPVESPTLRQEIIEEILPAYLNDQVKARELRRDGSYLRLKPKGTADPSQAQRFFRHRSRRQADASADTEAANSKRLIPITKVALV